MTFEAPKPPPDDVKQGNEFVPDTVVQDEELSPLEEHEQLHPEGFMLAVKPPRSVPTGSRIGQGGTYAGGDPTSGEASPELKAFVKANLEKHRSNS